jgi:hypothetical protein
MFNSVFQKIVPDMPQMTIRRMRYACWITKATDVYSKYVIIIIIIIIISFPRQKWFCECVTMLRLYVHYPSCFDTLVIGDEISFLLKVIDFFK